MSAKRVLVVDDEEDARVSIARLLEKIGFEVEAVAHGEDAVIAVQARKPELMVLDLVLPGIDGWTVIERLMPIGPPPVILLASRSDDPRSGPFQECIVGYLYKPLHYGELVTACRRLLSARVPDAGAERRQYRRRRLIVEVTLLSQDGSPAVTGKLVDLSAQGLQMEMSVSLAVGDKVRIILHVPGGATAQLALDGTVLWKKDAEGAFAYGLDLGTVPRDDARRLAAVLEP